MTRLFGFDRIATAIAVSMDGFPMAGSAGAVVLSRSDFYADALAGTPLAVAKHAPLLLTPSAALESSVLAEIQRVLPPGGTVYLLGGSAALDPSIETQLKGLGYTVVRYAAFTRYGTAAVIADQGLGNPATVFEATGLDFADALSGGAGAAAAHAAILLTAGSVQAPETASYLAAHPGDARDALGGPAAAADPAATPYVGIDRFDTGAKVATAFFTHPTVVGIASGLAFPDALSGGANIGAKGGPLVLAEPTGSLPPSVATYLTSNAATIGSAFVYGGTAAVGDDVLGHVQRAISGITPISEVRPVRGSWAWVRFLISLAGVTLVISLGQPRRKRTASN